MFKSSSSKAAAKEQQQAGSKDPLTNPGINNLGNSCYLNAVLQGLGASRPLRDALAEYPGADKAFRINSRSRSSSITSNSSSSSTTVNRREEGANGTPDPDAGGDSAVPLGTPTAETSPSLQLLNENPFPDSLPLSSALASTLVKLWAGKQGAINVKSLMRALNRKSEDWNEWDQMDAHELLRYLLDGVSMEEIDLIKKIRPQPSKPVKKARKPKKPRGVADELRRKAEGTVASSASSSSSSDTDDLSSSEAESLFVEDPQYRFPIEAAPEQRYTPFIETIFGGKLASVIVCEECRGVSRIEEDFLDISLPIKGDDGTKMRRRDKLRKFLSTGSATSGGSASGSSKSKDEAGGISRPRMAPRAPTAILSVSETEASEVDEPVSGGSHPARQDSVSSSGGGTSGNNAERGGIEDEHGAKVRRRKSLDPGMLRKASISSKRRSLFSPFPAAPVNLDAGDATSAAGGAERSRKTSMRLPGGLSSAATSGTESDTTRTSGASRRTDLSSASRRAKDPRTTFLAKPSKEEQDYIRKLFAEIPGPSPLTGLPLAGLRLAQPPGSHESASQQLAKPSFAEANGSALALQESTSTGVYGCLMQFTSVEVLEGENAFQCRRCWKLVHSDAVVLAGKKCASKRAQITSASAGNAQLHHPQKIRPGPLKHLQEDEDGTPRPSYRTTASAVGGGAGAAGTDESMIAVNRRLVAARLAEVEVEKQDAAREDAGTPKPSTHQNPPAIRFTESSPPMSPDESANGNIASALSMPSSTHSPGAPPGSTSPVPGSSPEVAMSRTSASTTGMADGSLGDDAGESAFSQLTVTASNGSDEVLSSNASISTRASEEGAEADEEEGSALVGRQRNVSGNTKTGAEWSRSSLGSVNERHVSPPSISFAEPARLRGSLPSAVESPSLPPRAQRYISRRAHKRYLVSALPTVLVLHLKRFQQTSKSSLFGSFNNLKKLDDKVTFPLYLDMSPFMAPPPFKPRNTAADAGEGEGRGRRPSDESGYSDGEKSVDRKHWFRRPSPSPETRSKCQYRLYGVICHEGNMNNGHYTCLIYTSQRQVDGVVIDKSESGGSSSVTKSDHEAPRRWIYCSDEIVRHASVDEVLRSQAYCLLYERVDPSSSSKL